ncbi:MAG: type I secretion system permease/ATPase [Pseudomonadota bacterium]
MDFLLEICGTEPMSKAGALEMFNALVCEGKGRLATMLDGHGGIVIATPLGIVLTAAVWVWWAERERRAFDPLISFGDVHSVGEHPDQDHQAETRNAVPLKTVQHAIWTCRNPIVGVLVFSLVINLLMLTGPLFMLQIYDRVLASRSVPTLVALLGIVAALFAIMGILDLIRMRVLSRAGVRIDRLLRDGAFRAMLNQAGPGSRNRAQLGGDLDRLKQFFASPAPGALLDVPWAPLYFVIIYAFHPLLGLVALAGAGCLVVLSLLNEILSRSLLERSAEASEETQSLAESATSNAETMNAMGLAAHCGHRWWEMRDAASLKQLQANDRVTGFTIWGKTLRLFLQSLILATGAYLVIGQEVTAGVMIAASIILSRALSPIEQCIGQWRTITGARRAASRLGDHLKALPESDYRTTLPTPEGAVVAEAIYAGPPGEREPILKGVTFPLAPGCVLAVIGPSASGKSTLARCLTGVWPLLRGAIRLDSAPLTMWPEDQRAAAIGYLPQDVVFFDGTIAENISRFQPGDTNAALLAATQMAQVHRMILELPEGYQTRLGPNGIALSGGQRQRLGLARALYGDPKLIVLDEPNASLDKAGEAVLSEVVRTLRGSRRTCVIISHRPSILQEATHILVLNHGRVGAFGPKDEVLSRVRAANNPATVPQIQSEGGRLGRAI